MPGGINCFVKGKIHSRSFGEKEEVNEKKSGVKTVCESVGSFSRIQSRLLTHILPESKCHSSL